MEIVKKDFSWLLERVPDINTFLNMEVHKTLILNGYLAGGFLRKAILAGSAMKVYAEISKVGDWCRHGDIDFFYLNEQYAKTAYGAIYKPSKFVGPNSKTGFAYEMIHMEYEDGLPSSSTKYQMIAKNTGTPTQVLSRFDISNCKIATDGLDVWMIEDWEELEKNKYIRVDNYAGAYLTSRLRKYLSPAYSVYPEQKKELLIKLLENIQEQHKNNHVWHLGPVVRVDHVYNVKCLITNNKEFLSPEEILLFYNHLGVHSEYYNYSKSSLSKGIEEDFALHMYKKRIKDDRA